MLWFKAWLETRWGVVFLLGLCLFVWTVAYTGSRSGPHDKPGKPEDLGAPMDVFAFSWIAAAATLAGTGIKTQSGGFQNTKGLHGSTQYTLSLPVSRRRLVAVRAAVGLLETILLILVLSGVAWLMFPELTAQSSFGDIIAYLLVVLVCSSSFHFLSVFLGTFLDDFLRLPGTMTLLAILIALDISNVLPRYVNIFRPMGSGSPLVTHAIPWTTLGVAVVASAVFCLAAIKIVQRQEY